MVERREKENFLAQANIEPQYQFKVCRFQWKVAVRTCAHAVCDFFQSDDTGYE